jgi:hypothetical protein
MGKDEKRGRTRSAECGIKERAFNLNLLFIPHWVEVQIEADSNRDGQRLSGK